MELRKIASSVATLTLSLCATAGLALVSLLNMVFAASAALPWEFTLLSSMFLLYPSSGILLDTRFELPIPPPPRDFSPPAAVRARWAETVTGLSHIRHLACIAAAASPALIFRSPTASVMALTTLFV